MLSFSFFVLFVAFNSAANSAAKALRDSGFNNLGYYSLALLNMTFGLGSIWAPKVVRKYSAKKAMSYATLTYAIWMLSLAMTTVILRGEYLGKEGITILALAIAFFCGPGPSVLWIGQGKYLSDCTQVCLERKGLYSSIFWTSMYLS